MQRSWRDLCWIGLLFLLPLLLFAPVTLDNKTILPADALYLFEPYKSAKTELNAPDPHNALLADLILENYPWKRFLVDAFKTRQLPLWDPYLFSGHPFLANGQHSSLYPLTWIFFLLPIPRAFGVFLTLQLGLAGISMYIFARTIRTSRHGAFFSGIVFQFSGFLIMSAVHPMIVAAASWLPLLLALIDLTVRRARFFNQPRAMLPWALIGAAVLGLQILAGHAEITYFVLLTMGAFSVWRLTFTAITHPRSAWKAEILSPALGLLILAGLGLALGAVQLIPLYEVVNSSFRQGTVSLADVLKWAYPKRRIITFLVPNFFGNPVHKSLYNFFSGETLSATINAYGNPISTFYWGIKNYVEGAAYVGILPLLLAGIAIISPPHQQTVTPSSDKRPILAYLRNWLLHPYIPFLTALSLFSLGCIFGTPLYAMVYALPFLNQSHSPFRWVFPLTVAISALAGLGATSVAKARESRVKNHKSRANKITPHTRPLILRILLFDTAPHPVSILGVLAIWGGILMFAGLWLSRLAFPQLESIVERVFWALANAPNAFPDHRAFYAYLFPWLQLASLLTIGAGITLRVSRCPIYLPQKLQSRPVWEVLAILILLIDLVAFGSGFNPAVDTKLLNYVPPVISFMKQDTGLWRFSTFDPHGFKTLNANTGMFYNLHDVRGYDSLFAAQYARYMGWIEPQGELPYNRIAPFTQFSSLDSPLTDLLNVKYIISEEEIPLPKYKQVAEWNSDQDNAVRVYENLGVTPRAFTLRDTATLTVPDVEAVGEAIQTYDPRFYTIIEASNEGWSGPESQITEANQEPQPGEPQAQAVAWYTPNEVMITATVDGPSWLTLADAYFPGWKAFTRPLTGTEDDETEVPIARVAGNFRGVYLEKSAMVRFKYSPNSVKVGAYISFLAGMTLIFFTGLWLWRRTYRETGDQSTVQRVAKNSIAPILLTLFNRTVDLALAMLTLRILGPANAGEYYFAGNVFIWFDIITNFGLNTYLTREVSRHREQARRYLLNTTLIRLALSILAIPLLAGYIGLRQTVVASLTQPASTQAIVALLLLYVGLVPTSISTGLTALFYAYEKAEYPAAITTVTTLLKAALSTLILLAGWGIIGLAGASIVLNFITLTILSVLAFRMFAEIRAAPDRRYRWRNTTERTQRREMVRESWLLMANHLLATFFFKGDVPLMEALLSSDALGRYSIGYKLLDMLNIVPAMFTMALFPILSRQAQQDQQGFTRFYHLGTKILLTLSLPAALITTLVAREMALVLGGPEYLPGSMNALQFMAWSMPIGWVNSLTQYVLIALNQQRYLTRAYLIGFSFSLVSNLLLMPRFGYRASAILHIFAELALLIPFIIGLRKHLGKVDWKSIISKPLLSAGIAGLIALALLPLGRWAALIGACLAYPLAIWKLNVLSPAERIMLSPLLKRSK